MCCFERSLPESFVHDLAAASRALRRVLEADACGELPNEQLQELLELAIKVYARKLETGGVLPPFRSRDLVTATDVVRVVSEMLDAVQLEVFELGMWRAWTRSTG